ncbi:MAG: DNA replication/repair protein RecF [Bacteroidota bacterium]|nr:DNA replication/repair protein RecF [Bacteroidota bacterium]
MFLQKLTLANFKNYPAAELQMSPKINCFIGNNGVGKTNLLDAIHYLSFCKSYFNAVDSQNVRHDESFFAIHGMYHKNGDKTDLISCVQKLNHKKQFKLNRKDYERLADHIGLFPLVMISPYDRDLINEGSDIRRKFLDAVISQFDKNYLYDLINYNKALTQRNSLLRQFSENHFFDPDLLDIWNEQMKPLANNIYQQRKAFIKDFIPIFQDYFDFISGGKEQVSIKYISHLDEENIDDLFSSSLEKDRALRYTSAGIHKDDLEFRIFDYPIKKFGSQGQQKSFVIAIKLAQFEYTKIIKGFKPILLFDDIFDKLDDNRVEQLIALVSKNSFGQVFITDTQRHRIEHIFNTVDIDHKIFEIKDDAAFEVSNGKES